MPKIAAYLPRDGYDKDEVFEDNETMRAEPSTSSGSRLRLSNKNKKYCGENPQYFC